MTLAVSRRFAAAVAGFALASATACGVMFGAEEGDIAICGSTSCTVTGDCPSTYCDCKDGTSLAGASCLTSRSCCATEETVCPQLCASYGGWAGGGSGGSGGSGGFGGSGGSGGTGGSALPSVGDACSDSGDISCGCTSSFDCAAVLQCDGFNWTHVNACDPGEACTNTFSGVRCGSSSYHTPYGVPGQPCNAGFGCTVEQAFELQCSGGFWQINEDCSSQGKTCDKLPGGTSQCPDPTSFCVGCL